MTNVYLPDPSGQVNCPSAVALINAECTSSKSTGSCPEQTVPDHSGRLDDCLACGGA